MARAYSDEGKRIKYYKVYCRYNELRKTSIEVLKMAGVRGTISVTDICHQLREEFDYTTVNTPMRILSYMTKVEKRGEMDEYRKLMDEYYVEGK
jgi:hypothetical protein